MDAVISGRAGRALLIDGDSLQSFDVDDPSVIVSRQLSDLPFLLGEAQDLRVIEDADLDSISRELQRASDSKLALDLFLLSLDSELPDDIRLEALEGLDALLADDYVVRQLENVLYACPLPERADLYGALASCTRMAAWRVLSILQGLYAKQASIIEVSRAWNAIPTKIFGGHEEQASFQHLAVREGLFRAVVMTHVSRAGMNEHLTLAALNPYIKSLPNHQQVLQHWAALFALRQLDQPDLAEYLRGASAEFSVEEQIRTPPLIIYSTKQDWIPSIGFGSQGTGTAAGLAAQAQEYGRKVADAASTAKDYVSDKMTPAVDRFRDLQNTDYKEVANQAKDYARQNPGQAILISAAAGLVIGLLIRGSRR